MVSDEIELNKLNKVVKTTFFDTFYVSFVILKPYSLDFCCMEKSSFDIYNIFPFEHDGEYIMILFIYSCTVPLNAH